MVAESQHKVYVIRAFAISSQISAVLRQTCNSGLDLRQHFAQWIQLILDSVSCNMKDEVKHPAKLSSIKQNFIVALRNAWS